MTKAVNTKQVQPLVALGILFSLLSAITYGLNPIFAKLAYSCDLSGTEILHARFIFAVVVLAVPSERFLSVQQITDKKVAIHRTPDTAPLESSLCLRSQGYSGIHDELDHLCLPVNHFGNQRPYFPQKYPGESDCIHYVYSSRVPLYFLGCL